MPMWARVIIGTISFCVLVAVYVLFTAQYIRNGDPWNDDE